MNNDPNSDSEQCFESKLSRVHKVHTLNPGCAHTAPRPCAGRRVVAPSGRVAGRVLQCRRTRAVSQLPSPPTLLVVTQNLCHDTTHATRRVASPAAGVAAFLRRVVWRCCAVLRHKRSPPTMIQNLYNDSPLAAKPCARAAARPTRRLTVSQGCWAYRGLLAARPTQLCHDIICCIVTLHKMKMGSSSFQLPFLHFFFSFFFSFVPATIRSQFFFSYLQ